MFDLFRSREKSVRILLGVLLGVVAVSMLIYLIPGGPGGGGGASGENTVATVGGDEITVREGEVLHIPSGVEHQAEALEDTFELDFFTPIRQDWLTPPDEH